MVRESGFCPWPGQPAVQVVKLLVLGLLGLLGQVPVDVETPAIRVSPTH